MLATKCESSEIVYDARDIEWLCDSQYTRPQILALEVKLLMSAGEAIRHSTVHSWYTHADPSLTERSVPSLVLDLTLRSVSLLRLPCRVVAEQLLARAGEAWKVVLVEHAIQKMRPQGEVALKYGDVLLGNDFLE